MSSKLSIKNFKVDNSHLEKAWNQQALQHQLTEKLNRSAWSSGLHCDLQYAASHAIKHSFIKPSSSCDYPRDVSVGERELEQQVQTGDRSSTHFLSPFMLTASWTSLQSAAIVSASALISLRAISKFGKKTHR